MDTTDSSRSECRLWRIGVEQEEIITPRKNAKQPYLSIGTISRDVGFTRNSSQSTWRKQLRRRAAPKIPGSRKNLEEPRFKLRHSPVSNSDTQPRIKTVPAAEWPLVHPRAVSDNSMSMNLRHAAALALVGWYLIGPPVRQPKREPGLRGRACSIPRLEDTA